MSKHLRNVTARKLNHAWFFCTLVKLLPLILTVVWEVFNIGGGGGGSSSGWD